MLKIKAYEFFNFNYQAHKPLKASVNPVKLPFMGQSFTQWVRKHNFLGNVYNTLKILSQKYKHRFFFIIII